MTSPAANAPTIGARSTAWASQESRKQKDRLTASKTPPLRSREAKEKSFGERAAPSANAPTRNTIAFARGHSRVPTVNAPPRSTATIHPVTAARMTSPKTSSITAAPKITRASLL
jgi:hypothetical protein